MNRQKWIDHALKSGFDSFEIYQSRDRERSLKWFEGEMDSFVTSRVLGTGFRGVTGGCMVNFATEQDDDSGMEEIIAGMLAQAEVMETDAGNAIRSPESGGEVRSARCWTRPSAAEIKSFLGDIEQRVLAYDKRISKVSHLAWEDDERAKTIVNSLGMDVRDQSYMQLLICETAAGSGVDVKTGYSYDLVPDINTFDRDAFVKKLCDDTLARIGATSLPSGSYKVIFERRAMTDLFTYLTDMYSGDLIWKGISPLREKLGEQIFSECITVTDDPRLNGPRGPVSIANYDDEGCPTRRKVVVDHGRFTTILHDTRSAARMGAASTGNGFRSSYSSAVDVQPMNMYIEPGDRSLEELCAEMGEGLVITDLAGLHAGLDPVTTDFSLQCSGYYVKGGRRDRGATLITVANNFLEMMKQVTAVGNDLKWNFSDIACPSIAFESCAISGE